MTVLLSYVSSSVCIARHAIVIQGYGVNIVVIEVGNFVSL